MTATTDAITHLAAAFRAADEMGSLSPDSECWLTFHVTPAEYEAIKGTAENVNEDDGGVVRSKVAYQSRPRQVRSSDKPIPLRCIDVTTGSGQ